VSDVAEHIREACAWVAARARHVRIDHDAIAGYAATLPLKETVAPRTPDEGEPLAAFWLTLDAVNFGSGWFPTLRKRPGRSGYHTIAEGIRERFEREGVWNAAELARIDRARIATVLGQDPDHELMELFARSLNDLGTRLCADYGGRFEGPLERACNSAVRLVELLAGWSCFADTSTYEGRAIPLLKRAQIAAADLHRTGVARFDDIDRLTMFADNLVPHVLRLDGVLRFAPDLLEAIEQERLIEHGSPEEVEIRACSVHAVELVVGARPGTCAADVDLVLWERGSSARYKASPRHRCRCTAY
jgi:Potential Queuosine, Q, salvage protein family